MTNPWIKYIDRSYSQIKTSLLNRLTISNPEVTDHSESNILIIILSMFAGVVEMLGYYIDNMAREAFVATARRFVSMVKLTKILDYRIKAANPSTVDLLFTFNNPLSADGVIPAGTIVNSTNNLPFVTTTNVDVAVGDTSASAGAKQVVHRTNINLGTTTGVANESFAIPLGNYVNYSSFIIINGGSWQEVTTLGFSNPLDKHYVVEIAVDGLAYIQFGNGINGAIPPSPFNVLADYDTTSATSGNLLENTITNLISTLSLPGVTTITVNNPLASTGGSGYEGIDNIRVNAPLSIRTLDRAVTKQDYRDITRMAPGVGKAEVDFNCGKTIQIYIAPVGGGLAASPLINSTFAYVELRKMITTFIEVKDCGETNLVISLDVLAKFRMDPLQVLADVQTALVDYGSFANQNINRKVKLSDIIALVDNLTKVDSLDITGIGTRPYARPRNHVTQLLWVRESLIGATLKSNWRITYTGVNSWVLVKNSVYVSTLTTSVPYTSPNNELTITIQPSIYTIGQTWDFTIYPFNKNIDIDDFSIPRINILDLSINVTEQLTPPII